MKEGRLDHLVVNTRFATDEARDLFSGLGFHLTPRGYHSLGSINHLAVFAEGYLELIGLPTDGGRLREEILDSPVGIDGLVLATDDAATARQRLVAGGFAVTEVQHFSRPVTIDGQSRDARFSTVRLLPGQLAAGRVYVCQHHTPELIWRPEWMRHPNGVKAIAGLLVVGADPAGLASRYAGLGKLDGAFTLDFAGMDQFAADYGALAAHAPQRQDFFGVVRLAGGDQETIAGRARAQGLPVGAARGHLRVALPAFHTLLEFLP